MTRRPQMLFERLFPPEKSGEKRLKRKKCKKVKKKLEEVKFHSLVCDDDDDGDDDKEEEGEEGKESREEYEVREREFEIFDGEASELTFLLLESTPQYTTTAAPATKAK